MAAAGRGPFAGGTLRLPLFRRMLMLCGVLAVCRVAPACAQNHPITWSLSTVAKAPRQGVAFPVMVRARIPSGWHVYSTTQPPGGPIATVIAPVDHDFVFAGLPSARDPDVSEDSAFAMMITETYRDSVSYRIPVIARVAGAATLRIKVRYETCTNRICMPPVTDLLTLSVNVATGAVATRIATVSPPPPSASPPPAPPQTTVARAPPAANAGALPGGTTAPSLALFLLLAAGMGALSLLTPCVFPMIPITVSYFTRTHETTRAHPARNAMVYAVGIVATFTVLGMAIAVLVGAGGVNRFAANPWINLLVAAIFIAFALNLFGLYQIGVPAALLTRLDRVTRRSGVSETAGILLMGLTFTLTSFTCTTPFVGTVLVMAAGGSWLWPLSGLLVFSAVFALPFFLLAMVPSAVAMLPRSGAWLQSVKVMMGFIELAMAMKFLSNADLVLRWGLITRTVVLVIWLGIAVLTATYLLSAVGRGKGEPAPRLGWVRIGSAAAALALGVYLGSGLLGHRMGELESFLPPPEGAVQGGVTAVPGEMSWMVNDYAGGLARARSEQKPVLIDFTGYTCTNCRWMEANMFPRPAVTAALRRFVRVRLYTDGEGPLFERQQRLEQQQLGTVALPYYAIVDSLGVVQARFLGMTRSTDEFVDFLVRGRSSTAP